jgi:dTDP-4-amino-4,6-dideoxygalactose transaminase
MKKSGFAPWPSFTEEEADAVSRVLLSNKVNYWTGDICRQFEQEYAAWCGSKHAISLMNGTVALEIALRALDIGAGDDVIVAPRTYLASASCVVMAGARPIFADVDRNSGNITAESIRAVLSPATKAILCVHLGGWPCDMDPIMALANERGIKVIEDCAQAHGACYNGRSVGVFGQIGAWSFCQDKIITTGGEGGMVTTDSDELWSKLWSLKDHGKSWDAVNQPNDRPGFKWVHESFGTNGRMLEMQAAIGRIQLERLPEWHKRRTENANRIIDECRRSPAFRAPTPPAGSTHAWYKLYAYVKPEHLAKEWTRDRIIEEIVAKGVPCYAGSCPEVYLEKAWDSTGFRPAQRLPIAKELGETSLMFHVHPTLTDDEITETCHAIRDVMARATV